MRTSRKPEVLEDWVAQYRNGLSASIGIARFPTDGANYFLLLQRADQALYLAKAKDKNGCAFWNGFA